MKHFIPPWGKPDGPKYGATLIERHTAMCRSLRLPDDTTPIDVAATLTTVDQAKQDAARANAANAVVIYNAMTAWHPATYDPSDTSSVRQWIIDHAAYDSHMGLWGGRGGGKSHGAAEAIIELSSIGKERVVCVREFQTSIKESVKELLETKIKASRWANQWKTTEYELENIVTGSRITFVGIARNTTAVKSLEGATLVLCEEAADLSSTSIDILVPTVMRMKTSRMIWVWNPVTDDVPVDVMFRSGELPERSSMRCILAEDNAFFYTGKMPGEMRTSYNKHGAEKFRWIWRGAYRKMSELAVYQNWSIGRADISDTALTPRYGLDWGWTDPLAGVEFFVIEPKEPVGVDGVKERGVIYITAEIYGSKIPPQDIPTKLDESMPLARAHTITADSSEPKSINDLEGHGFHVLGAVKGPGSIRAGIGFIQGYDIIVSPDCPNVASELSLYSWKTNKKGVVLRDPEDVDNHLMDALRYGIEGYTPPPAGDNSVVYI